MGILKKLFGAKEREAPPLCSVIVVAAGSATRMEGRDKIRHELDGTPVIIHSLRPFEYSPLVQEIVLVTRHEAILELGQLCKLYGLEKVTKILPGGETRTRSVQIGLAEARSDSQLLAIHDGARPLVTQVLLEEVIRAAALHGAAAPGIPLKDTIKRIEGGIVQETLPRESLRAIQTPQVFECSLIRAAIAKAEKDAVVLTDDCAAVERLGFPVLITQGDEANIKLTTPADLLLAEQILLEREAL